MMNRTTAAMRVGTRSAALSAIAVAAATALPAGATAKVPAAPTVNWSATVIAKDADRGRLITAGRGGEVRTIVTSERQAARTRLGQRIKTRVKRDADGTYDANRLRATGKVKRTRVRGAVVEREAGRYLVSAGGSVFSIKTKTASRKLRASASAAAVGAGDIVVTDVKIAANGVVEQRTRDVGDVTTVELEGLFLSLEGGILTIAVEDRGTVKVTVPSDLAVHVPAAGAEIEVLVSIAETGFTLVALADEDGAIDFDYEDGKADIEGIITELADTSVTVQGRGGVTLTCDLPSGAELTGFAVGDAVELECAVNSTGSFVLRELESENAEFEFEADDEGEDRDDSDRQDDED